MSRDFMAERVDTHDSDCGKMAGQLIKMGFFTEEFVSYGTTYWKDGMRWYFISNHYKKVYDFIRESKKNGIYCTPIEKQYRREQVLAGESEKMSKKNKLELAERLQSDYSELFFKKFSEFSNAPNTDTAKPLLDAIRIELAGTFDYDALNIFKSINEYAFDAKKVSMADYLSNLTWVEQEKLELRKNMVGHDNHSRRYAGFAYKTSNGGLKYYDNALFDLTAMRRYELMLKGEYVTPIYEKQYYFGDIAELTKISKNFSEDLTARYDANYFRLLNHIDTLPSPIDVELYRDYTETIEKMGTEKEKKMTIYYANMWHI